MTNLKNNRPKHGDRVAGELLKHCQSENSSDMLKPWFDEYEGRGNVSAKVLYKNKGSVQGKVQYKGTHVRYAMNKVLVMIVPARHRNHYEQ